MSAILILWKRCNISLPLISNQSLFVVKANMYRTVVSVLMTVLLALTAGPGAAAVQDELQAQCATKSPQACYRFGTYLEHEVGDPAAALAHYRMACDSNYARACTNLGSLYGRGAGTAVNHPKAAALYRKGCDGKDMVACANLGDFLLRGLGVAADSAAGVALYQKACSGGDKISCRDLGMAYVTGKNVPQNPPLGATWLRKACDGGLPQACGDLAYLHHKGIGVTQDSAAAQRLFRASCDGGYKQACQMVR